MQPLIQPILSQIIDSCFYIPERFSDFSCWKFPQELLLLHLETSYHLNRALGQKFTSNAKNGFEFLKLIWSGTFAIFNTEPLWFWSRIESRVKISHYIQLCNLYSALRFTYINFWIANYFWCQICFCLVARSQKIVHQENELK